MGAEAEPYYGYAAHAVAPVGAPTPPPLSSLTPSPPSLCPTPSTLSLPSSPATPRSPPPPLSTVGIAPAAIPAVGGAYAGAGRYVANSAGTVHVAKREAEADP